MAVLTRYNINIIENFSLLLHVDLDSPSICWVLHDQKKSALTAMATIGIIIHDLTQAKHTNFSSSSWCHGVSGVSLSRPPQKNKILTRGELLETWNVSNRRLHL